MIHKIKGIIETIKTDCIQCDCCGAKISPNDFAEFQEVLKIRIHCGYGSIFGDEKIMAAEFCQECVRKLLGLFLRECNEKD